MYYYDKKPDVSVMNEVLICPYSASQVGMLCVTRRLSFPVGAGNRFLRRRQDVIPVSQSSVTIDKERVCDSCRPTVGHFPCIKVISSDFKSWKLARGKAEVSVSFFPLEGSFQLVTSSDAVHRLMCSSIFS